MKKKTEHIGRNGKRYYEEKPSPKGYTACPECGKYVATATVGACPNPECNHVFTRKEKAGITQLSPDDPMARVLAVFDRLDALATVVDLDTVLPALAEIEATPEQLLKVLEIAQAAGGLDKLAAAWPLYRKWRQPTAVAG
jgi:hypothetical protein